MATKKTLSATTKETVLDALQVVFDDARADFAAEQAERLAEANRELARKKEEDTYNFNIEKRNREDALKDELAKRSSDVADREAKVAAREAIIGDAEVTIGHLQKQVEGIPAVAAKSEAAGYAKGVADAKKESDAEIRLINAENAADKRILEAKIDSLESVVDNQAGTIETLKKELADANARVSEIATASVNAAGQSKVTVNAAQGK